MYVPLFVVVALFAACYYCWSVRRLAGDGGPTKLIVLVLLFAFGELTKASRFLGGGGTFLCFDETTAADTGRGDGLLLGFAGAVRAEAGR